MNVLDELGFPTYKPVTVYQDNSGSIAFSLNEVNHSKMKHIAMRECFIRETVQENLIAPKYVSSAFDIADIFTKALGPNKFQELGK